MCSKQRLLCAEENVGNGVKFFHLSGFSYLFTLDWVSQLPMKQKQGDLKRIRGLNGISNDLSQ